MTAESRGKSKLSPAGDSAPNADSAMLDPDEEALLRLGGVLRGYAPDRLRAYMAALDGPSVEVAERALAHVTQIGWRASPSAMAAQLTGGRVRRYAYTELLSNKFVDAVEGRSKRQIWMVPARYGKPVSVDELVLMADGSPRRLGDVAVGDLVVSHLGRPCQVIAVHEQGSIETLRIRTAAGREIEAAPDHPFLTPEGWCEATDLRPREPNRPGDVLAVVVADELGATERVAEEFRLAGYLIGDGSLTHNACNLTCADPREAADFETCAEKLGWVVTITPRPAPHASRYGLRRTPGAAITSGPRQWCRDAGIAQSTSHTKRVPAWVFSAPKAMVAEFIGAYFACDGSTTAASGVSRGRAVEFYSVARPLLADVRALLARLGIYARLSTKDAAAGATFMPGPHRSYRLTITGSDAIARFVAAIPVHHAKGERLRALGVARQQFDARWLPDEVIAIVRGFEAECRCLTIRDDESFVVQDVAVHNSFIGSKWGPTWALDRDPSTNLILASYGDDLAKENAVFIRDALVQYDDLLSCRLRPDRRRMDRFVTDQGGGIIAAGIGSALTGFGGVGAIVDDPFKNWQEAHSEARRQLVWDWFRAVLRLRLEGDQAWIIVVMTRWHEADLAGKLLDAEENDDGETWDVVRLPALADTPDDLLGRQIGEPLEPQMFSLDAVHARARSLGSYLSSGLEQQRPSPEEGTDIMRGWWRWYDVLPPRFDDELSSWDMKLKDKESGDFVVGQWWGRTGSDFWLGDQLRGRYNFATAKAAMVLLQVRHPSCRRHIVENAGYGPEVMGELRRPQRDYRLGDEIRGLLGITDAEVPKVEAIFRRGMTGLLPENPKGDKRARMRAQTPLIEAGHVHVPTVGGIGELVVNEASAFPNGEHDDQVDALSQALKRMSHGTGAAWKPPGQVRSPKPGARVVPKPVGVRSKRALVQPGRAPRTLRR